ncbi:MAG: M20/M25/M40 family metallo-hydrolase, partial [Acidobacteriota bacterium]|nr:M20/M25/M40 family metallo-hydrolase [Acidobacteriota bacterium]
VLAASSSGGTEELLRMIAVLAPVGMIFVPSRDGISHSPREFTSLSHITNGARVLLESLRRLDGALD